ncbi:hypothetical protein Vi05172_g2181 [Venturia inaequalis]|nr:hypothetical protein Vi05172_g2181 [Venturia inaequalis]
MRTAICTLFWLAVTSNADSKSSLEAEARLPIGGSRSGRFEMEPALKTTPNSLRIPELRRLGYTYKLEYARPFHWTGSGRVSEHIFPLRSPSGDGLVRKQSRNTIAGGESQQRTAISPIKSIRDEVFTTPLDIGGQLFDLIVDVGSSDTWVVVDGFRCLKSDGCQFGPTYKKTSSYSQTAGQYFDTKLTDGTKAIGLMATEKFGLGNISLSDQAIGFVNSSWWQGDMISSGILGLGFPSHTNARNATIQAKDQKGAKLTYAPIFTKMYRSKMIDPVFSIALNRIGEEPGVLALGGLPDASIRHSEKFSRAPMQLLSLIPKAIKSEDGLTDYGFYVVNADSITINSQSAQLPNGPVQLILDSGSRFSHLPKTVIDALVKAWKPKPAYGILGWLTQEYRVGCDDKPPQLGIVLNGTTVAFDGKDLIAKVAGGICVIGVANSPNTQWVLGANFMRSVVTVFDVGAAEMRFASRIR